MPAATATSLRYKIEGAHGISAEYDGDKLIIRVTKQLRSKLRRMRRKPELFGVENFCSDQNMYDILEPLTANSELEWVDAEHTGDLTSAPILGILGPDQTSRRGPFGAIHVGRWENDAGMLRDWYQPIQMRWGYEPYALRSPVDDLADDGEVIFRSKW
jgi:hypothetical protein